MFEEQNVRVDGALKKLASDIDKQCLRKMQADMHMCAARCCSNSEDSMEKVHNCVQSCTVNLARAQKYVQDEIENFQNRLQRCVLQCSDEASDKLGVNPTESQVRMYNNEFEGCAIKCVEKHINLIPTMLKNMHDELGKEDHLIQHAKLSQHARLYHV